MEYEPEIDTLTEDFLLLVEKYQSLKIPLELIVSNQIMNLFLVANMNNLKFAQVCEMVLRGSASFKNAKQAVKGD